MNKHIETYFSQIESTLIQSSSIIEYKIIRKEISNVDGKIRIQLNLCNEDLADLFEYIISDNDKITIKKYHFHWQDKNNNIIKRWDNAPHHKELDNFPHHIHYQGSVEPSKQIPNILHVIGEIEVKLKNTK